jgi:hypothetical protein
MSQMQTCDRTIFISGNSLNPILRTEPDSSANCQTMSSLPDGISNFRLADYSHVDGCMRK